MDSFTLKTADPYQNTCEQLHSFMQHHRGSKRLLERELVALCEYACATIDLDEYERVKQYHMSDDSPMPKSRYKYFDLLFFLKSKLRTALELGLHEKAPIDILDIGTGPSHFAFTASFYGHRVLTTDIPDCKHDGCYKKSSAESLYPNDGGSVYSDFIRLMGVERIIDRVEPFKLLGDYGRRFDLITALMINFDKYWVEKELWGLGEWRFFFDDVMNHQLTDSGEIYLRLNRGAEYTGVRHDEASFVSFIKDVGGEIDIEKCVITCTKKSYRGSRSKHDSLVRHGKNWLQSLFQKSLGTTEGVQR